MLYIDKSATDLPLSSEFLDGIDIRKTEARDVRGMKIQCNVVGLKDFTGIKGSIGFFEAP